MAAKWLSSARKKPDIRDFIVVHGKILKTSPVKRTTIAPHANMRQTTVGTEPSRASAAPASRFSTGVRRKVTATLPPEKESEMKENIIPTSVNPSQPYGLRDCHRHSNCSGKLLASSSSQVSHSKKATAIPVHAPKEAPLHKKKARKRLKRSNSDRHWSSSSRQALTPLSDQNNRLSYSLVHLDSSPQHHNPVHSDHSSQHHNPVHSDHSSLSCSPVHLGRKSSSREGNRDTPTQQESASGYHVLVETPSRQSRSDQDVPTDELNALRDTGNRGKLSHHTSSLDLFTETGDIHDTDKESGNIMESSSGSVSWIDAELPTQYKLSSALSSDMNCDTNELLAELSGCEKFLNGN